MLTVKGGVRSWRGGPRGTKETINPKNGFSINMDLKNPYWLLLLLVLLVLVLFLSPYFFLSRKKPSEVDIFSSFGKSMFSPIFSMAFGWSSTAQGYIRNHDSHLGMCLGHLLANYGCSSTSSFRVILIQLGWGWFLCKWDFWLHRLFETMAMK